MHTLLSLSALHRRVLAGNQEKLSVEELEHTQLAVSLFNKTISGPLRDVERDAVFATATLMNAIFFATIETVDPWKSWPMNDAAFSLQWLRLQAGVALAVQAANPTRPSSVFSSLFQYVEPDSGQFTETAAGCKAIPILFQRLFDVDEKSTIQKNPYHAAVRLLTPLLSISCRNDNIMFFLPFIGYMDTRLIELLERKDHRALLLLGIWFGFVRQCGQWWLTRRVDVEYQSIEIYLQAMGASTPSEIIPLVSSWNR